MTDHYELLGSIRSALTTIADHYDEALEPAKVSSGIRSGGSAEARMPLAEFARAARAATFSDIRYWCHFVLDEVRAVDGQKVNEKVDGENFDAMLAFVSKWADRIVTDHPDDAETLNTEMRGHGEVLHNIVFPPGRDWMPIGNCPITVADENGNSVPCGHMVRAYPLEIPSLLAWSSDEEPVDLHRTDNPVKFIRCPGCGTEDTLTWWMSQIVPEGSDHATATEVIAYVAMHAGLILHHDQLRQWASRDHIRRHGKDTKGRTLYSTTAVLEYARHQTKEHTA